MCAGILWSVCTTWQISNEPAKMILFYVNFYEPSEREKGRGKHKRWHVGLRMMEAVSAPSEFNFPLTFSVIRLKMAIAFSSTDSMNI